MRRTASQLALGAGCLALVLYLAAPTVLLGQAQPTLPTPLPAPKAPAPAGQAAQPTPPAAPQPGVASPGQAGRDPFDPLVTRSGAEGERTRPLTGLRLVGVVWDAKDRSQIRALVETPDGLGYYVRLNEEKFGGRVVALDRDRVRFSVREQIPGGPARERTVELKLGSK